MSSVVSYFFTIYIILVLKFLSCFLNYNDLRDAQLVN